MRKSMCRVRTRRGIEAGSSGRTARAFGGPRRSGREWVDHFRRRRALRPNRRTAAEPEVKGLVTTKLAAPIVVT
jgi:hypothetical protein